MTTADAVAAAGVAAATASALRKGRMRNHQENDERSKEFMHCSSAIEEGKDGAELQIADGRLQIEFFNKSAISHQQSAIRSVCRQCFRLRIPRGRWFRRRATK